MQQWLKYSLLVCVTGFLKEIRPSDPHAFHDYLLTKGITPAQVHQEILPVRVYSNLVNLLFVILSTDLCRYKPLIILLGCSSFTASALFIWSTALYQFQVAAFLLGLSDALEVAYFTYIYAKVDKEYYRQVTSFTVGALLAGNLISGLTSQLMLSTKWMSFAQLHYITFTFMLLATIWSCFLPPVGRSAYFNNESEAKLTAYRKTCNAFLRMKKHIAECFRNTYVLKWITWLSLTRGSFILVVTYIQLLWGDVAKERQQQNIYNGAAEAVYTVVGFLAALWAGRVKYELRLKLELILTLGSLVMGFSILIASQASSLWTCYACYVLYGGMFYLLSTTGVAEIMKQISEDSYGLIVGVVMFFALIVEACLAMVITKSGLFDLTYRQQNLVCGLAHILIAVLFIIIGLVNWVKTAEQTYSRAF